MLRPFKIIVGALALFGATVIGFLTLSWSNQGKQCDFYPTMTVVSGSGAMTAEVAQRRCEQPSETKTYVLVFESNKPSKKWTVFVAHSAVPVAAKGEYEPLALQVKWFDDKNISIKYPQGAGAEEVSYEKTEHGVSVFSTERTGEDR